MPIQPRGLRHRMRELVFPSYGAGLKASRAVAQMAAQREQAPALVQPSQTQTS
jgi:hypothetical protein